MPLFHQALTDFIFVEDIPKHSDIIFIPGGSCGRLPKTLLSCITEDSPPGYWYPVNTASSPDTLTALPHRKNTLAPLFRMNVPS